MRAYIDASVLLRIALDQPGRLRWRRVTAPVASELVRIEALRTLDRLRVSGHMDDEEVALRRSAVLDRLEAFELIGLSRRILERASEPFPTSVGTLGAIHLATAVAARRKWQDLVLATHDDELAIAARAVGFPVLG